LRNKDGCFTCFEIAWLDFGGVTSMGITRRFVLLVSSCFHSNKRDICIWWHILKL